MMDEDDLNFIILLLLLPLPHAAADKNQWLCSVGVIDGKITSERPPNNARLSDSRENRGVTWEG